MIKTKKIKCQYIALIRKIKLNSENNALRTN